MSKAQLLTDIVGFLQDRIVKGEVAGDEKESLELAIDCIRDTFNVSESAQPQDLLAIYERGTQSAKSPEVAASATSTEAAAAPEVSAEVKAAADELKAKGNKLMGQRDFKGAADAYTEAIEKNPNNPLYYSNRAAAFTHLGLNARAVEDARKATQLDPSYSKAWSRLGLALWAQGDTKGSLDAYEAGLKAEGDSPSEAMKRDYDNVLKRYNEEKAKSDLQKSGESATKEAGTDAGAGAGAGAGTGGGFDFSQLSSLMSNPQVQQMAKNLMSNPSALGDLMNSPMAQQMKEKFSQGGMPDISKMMGDKNVQDMMKDFQ